MMSTLNLLSQRRLCDGVLVMLPGLVLGVAAVSKLLELDAFARAVASWRVIPPDAVDAIAVVVPSLELAAAFGCFRSSWVGPLLGATVVASFTGAYTAEYILAGPPECGCFGAFATYQLERSSAGWVIGRNVLLMGFLLSGALLRLQAEFRRREAGQCALQKRSRSSNSS